MSKILDVCLPGTGGMMPLENRWLSCCWLEYMGKAILIDCGEGTQIALKKSRCRLSHLDVLLITHFHADHIAGLPGLLLTLGNFGKKSPLTIVGPVGLEQVVKALTIISPILPFPLKITEIEEEKEGCFRENGMIISYLPVTHGVPCFGYKITIERKPIFNPQKAYNLGIPREYFKKLHEGQSVKLNDGRHIEPDQVLDGKRNPIRVCYFTDTIPTVTMGSFANGVDLLISEGMYNEDNKKNMMADKGHMLFSDSARIAKEANVKQLWITHFSPALVNPNTELENIHEIFPKTIAAYDGIRIAL